MRQNDPFLEKRLVKYDKWLSMGQISCASKVIPVSESLRAQKWVLPAEQMLELLRNAKSVALQDCECRTHYGRCDKPLEVCMILDEIGDKLVEKGEARHITLDEAAEVLRNADESGLVHLSLYMPDHKVWALCSCCECCCHDIRIVKEYGRKDILVRAEYAAETDMAACIHCGDCVPRCAFEARSVVDGRMVYDSAACLGCGLCVSVCPVEATGMVKKL
jgi:ferredoxin